MPNWDIGHFSWDIASLKVGYWDIIRQIICATRDRWASQVIRFGILECGSYEFGH